jgi:WD40 repeat protein
LGSEVWDVAWSSTAEHIVTWTEDGKLQKWSNVFESATIVAEAKHDYASSLEFSPDDKLIVSSDGWTAKLWRASDLSLVWEWSGYWYPAFHPMGRRLFLFGVDSVFDVNTEDLENVTATEHNLNYDVHNAVFDPSGNTFAATTYQGVKIVNAKTFEDKTSLPYINVQGLRFTPDGNYLFLVLLSKTVVLWDVAAGCVVEEMILDMEMEYVSSAQISKSCRVLSLHHRNVTNYTVHLGSTCY